MDYIRNPSEIEEKSLEIIENNLGEKCFPGLRFEIIKRVIHTTADFDYYDMLQFKDGVDEKIMDMIKKGVTIITDTNMVKSGINKRNLELLGCKVNCFVDSYEAKRISEVKGITRSIAAIDVAANLEGSKIFLIGNAPTAIYRIVELYDSGILRPEAVVAVPVGFVGAAEAKDLIYSKDIPCIITKGRKGGSTIAAAIINAIMKEALKNFGG